MKIAITGHNTGVGPAIESAFRDRGHEVIGLSSSNGYKYPESYSAMVAEIEPCDIFVNNLYYSGDHYSSNAQLELLYEFANRWSNVNKHIITIGSKAAEVYTWNKIDRYSINHHALDAAHRQLYNRLIQLPKVTILKLGYTDVPSTAGVKVPKLSPEEVANTVMWVVDATFSVGSITLCKQKLP